MEQLIWFWNFGGKLVANIREIFTKLIRDLTSVFGNDIIDFECI